MSKSKHEISEFIFVGQLSDCIISKKARIKYFKIANGEEKNWIKLSKKNRNSLEKKVILGSWLKVKGQRKICLETGIIEFKADTIELTTTKKCNSKCDRCDFKRLVYSGAKKEEFCSNLEAGLYEHFRIRGNFRFKKRRG
ncbi:MAG: hypothetical protein ACFBSE_10125 [Prochloraceae cyanobacterium]